MTERVLQHWLHIAIVPNKLPVLSTPPRDVVSILSRCSRDARWTVSVADRQAGDVGGTLSRHLPSRRIRGIGTLDEGQVGPGDVSAAGRVPSHDGSTGLPCSGSTDSGEGPGRTSHTTSPGELLACLPALARAIEQRVCRERFCRICSRSLSAARQSSQRFQYYSELQVGQCGPAGLRDGRPKRHGHPTSCHTSSHRVVHGNGTP